MDKALQESLGPSSSQTLGQSLIYTWLNASIDGKYDSSTVLVNCSSGTFIMQRCCHVPWMVSSFFWFHKPAYSPRTLIAWISWRPSSGYLDFRLSFELHLVTRRCCFALMCACCDALAHNSWVILLVALAGPSRVFFPWNFFSVLQNWIPWMIALLALYAAFND